MMAAVAEELEVQIAGKVRKFLGFTSLEYRSFLPFDQHVAGWREMKPYRVASMFANCFIV